MSTLFKKILIAFDFSNQWPEFLSFITSLFPHSFYYLFSVIDSSKFIGRGSTIYEDYVSDLINDALSSNEPVLQEKKIKYEVLIKKGMVVPCIQEVEKKENVDLLVIASHSAVGTKRLKLGGIAREILMESKIPVLIMNSVVPPVTHPRLLNPTTGSQYSYKASYFAVDLSRELEGSLTTLYLYQDTMAKNYLDTINSYAQEKEVAYHPQIAEIPPLEAIMEEAKNHDLIVGSRGYKSFTYKFRFLFREFSLDSTVRNTITLAGKPILLICD